MSCSGSDGREVLTVARNGLNMRPQPFKCRFTPRSEEIRQAIEREGREALRNLSVYDGKSERIRSFFQKAKQEARAFAS